MKFVVPRVVVGDVVDRKLSRLKSDISSHESNLKTVEQAFNEMLKTGIVTSRFVQYCKNRVVSSDISSNLLDFIWYELSSRCEQEIESVSISVIPEDTYYIKTNYVEFTLDNRKFYAKFDLGHKACCIITDVKKLDNILDKCRYVKEFILDDEEYQFIFGE